MLNKREIIAMLEAHAPEIRAFGVVGLELFGSFARGQQRPDSDIDLLVAFAPGRGLFRDHAGLLNLLEDLLGRNIDLVKCHLLREELKPHILGGDLVAAKI